MTKIDIFSGFLGAGKTTLIKKLISEAYKGEKLVLIENEFGEIGIDGGFLKEAGIEITEMNSGCICCSLVGDFGEALKKVLDQYNPDRILIEPSGVGKLSDVIKAVKNIDAHDILLNGFTTVVDAGKCKMYMKNFGEFFNDQIEHAGSIVLSHTDNISDEKLNIAILLIREHNSDANLITTPWSQIDGTTILQAIENRNILKLELDKLAEETEHHHHHHHHHDENCDCHEHHHHHEDEHCDCHEHHEHHHEHDENCHCHEHHEHHHHHADEVFTSIGRETAKKFTVDTITNALNALCNEEKYGLVLRAKGIVAGVDGKWIHFDYVPGEPDVRTGGAETIGRMCVIGSNINEEALIELFGL